ncbi:antichymotrypsin-2-like isoform X4 [Ceratina calcarata]|uniref:Antichymotrypsin-2-like isoform X4 n=1 Tax=Ceratina calcarata TaxID=156304 RepID=A0AAJ7IX04_9HYME|nr:antichymotrypsin-2-like isoform X4 [Ceratina calcarata]
MRILIGSLVVAFASIAMTQADDAKLENELEALNAVSQSSNQFSSSFFKTVVDENPGNLISSPLSAAVVLAMTGYGAGGETANQFKKVLHLPSPDSLGHTGYQKLIDTLNNVKKNKLLIANKVFTTDKFPPKPTYTQLTQTYFRSATQMLDFAKNVEAAQIINAWVEQNTNNLIKDLIQAGDLSSDTAMVLVNAIYFKGKWQHKFDAQFTEDRPFHITKDTTKNVPTMFRRGDYRYGVLSDMNAKFVEIPYKGQELSMVIILPDEIDGLPQLEAKLQNTSLTSILQHGHVREVELFLPKFKAESEIQLNSVLQKMGLVDAFSGKANFSGISDAPLQISKVVQKAFIEVNEEGSEAAAATGVILAPSAIFVPLLPPVVFKADRPFYFAIYREDNNQLLIFSGLMKTL